MKPGIAKLRALTRVEREILLIAVLLQPVFWIALRAFGLLRLQAWFDRLSPGGRQPRLDVPPARIGTLVNVAGRYVPGLNTCLSRSLLLRWLLRRRGIRCELRIGVRLHQGEFQAHAWVEHQGKPINDADDIGLHFAPFDEPLSYKLFSWS